MIHFRQKQLHKGPVLRKEMSCRIDNLPVLQGSSPRWNGNINTSQYKFSAGVYEITVVITEQLNKPLLYKTILLALNVLFANGLGRESEAALIRRDSYLQRWSAGQSWGMLAGQHGEHVMLLLSRLCLSVSSRSTECSVTSLGWRVQQKQTKHFVSDNNIKNYIPKK